MHVLRYVLCLPLLALLLSLWLATVSAQEGEPPEDEPWPGGIAPEEPPPPEGVRRPRPKTDEEERRYKQEKTRSDPFLNAPPPAATKGYNPADWVSVQLPLDRSLYLIQDAKGVLQGTLSINSERHASGAGDYIRVTKVRSTPAERVELTLFSETLRPRRVTIQHAARGASGTQLEEDQRTDIDYLFDRIVVERSAGPVQTAERMRQLPFSFDIEQLPLLVRLLKFAELDRQSHWPFEALVTEPRHKRTRQLRIDKPRRAELLSAEPANYPVYELQMQLDDAVWTWWVERFAPNRLVRFSDGKLTYTLHEYSPANSY